MNTSARALYCGIPAGRVSRAVTDDSYLLLTAGNGTCACGDELRDRR